MAINPDQFIQDVGMASSSTAFVSRLALVPFDEIRCGIEPPYLVKGLIPREGLTVV